MSDQCLTVSESGTSLDPELARESHHGLPSRAGNVYADQYLNAADRLGLGVEMLDEGRGLWVIDDGSRRLSVSAAILGCNNLVAARCSSNKFLTNLRLRRAGVRVPDCLLLDTRDLRNKNNLLQATMQFAEGRYPVVLKPISGSGGHRVFADIGDQEELRQVVDELWAGPGEQLLIEQHIHGNHYRVKLFDGELIDLVARYPGSVIGDGTSTIEELVEQKNAVKRERGNAPISLTGRSERLLARTGRSIDTVLDEEEKQQLVVESNLYLGGDTERLPIGLIKPGLSDFLRQASAVSGLRWLGLDLIVDDIRGADAHLNACINETSSAHVPNDFHANENVDQYLQPAMMILERFFGLPKTTGAMR